MGARAFRKQLEREGRNIKASTRARLKRQADNTIQNNIEFDRIWKQGFGTTLRKNSEIVVGSFRDIDDLGNFGNPENRKSFWQGNTFVVEWDTGTVPYAKQILEGWVTRSGKVIPGRNPASFTDGDIRV